VRALEADLIGPFRLGVRTAGGDYGVDAPEELKLPPSRWYLTGFLAPDAGREEEEEANEELAMGNDQTEEDTGGSSPDPKKKNFMPASMGLTVFIPKGVAKIKATVTYANYDRLEIEDSASGKKKPQKKWTRVPMPPVTEEIDLTNGSLEGEGIAVSGALGLRLEGQVRPVTGMTHIPDGTQAVSVFLVNRRAPDTSPGFRDRGWVFQVHLELECSQGFFGRPDCSGLGSGELDEATGDLQYRGMLEYGVGHGVSVVVPEEQTVVTRVQSCWLPHYEVRRVIARTEDGVTVSMEKLAEIESDADIDLHLSQLPKAYSAWINEQAKIDVVDEARKDAQKELLSRARKACERIEAGIAVLKEQEDLREAFCSANRAMAMAARKKRPHVEPEWRLFQLAFVLLNLRGLSDPKHPDREKAELIFFPTGGGKTEAYLGVIAITLLLRRLRSQNTPHRGLGVAVILRYTLRLLTLDQLGRAAALVCALEILRRDDPRRLGPERFSVGLWVGSSATANTMKVVQKSVTQFQARTAGNPAPLVGCPWCNHELTPASLSLRTDGAMTSTNPEEVHVGCLNDACEFCAANNPEGIPVVFVDEQLYRELPSFLIGTVDKFAMIPWRGETGKLFGKVSGRVGHKFFNATDGKTLPKGATPLPEGALPPELIVQDELHLISGPLGTMVGLYETAIDFLCRREVDGHQVRPKVIAATATVRRATEQMQALYGRKASDVSVFPPPAVNAMDTYFSLIDEKNPGRLYLGVGAQGRSMKAILLRVYRCMLAAGLKQYADGQGTESTRDAYTTVAGYFNSLRELGGMRRIAEDDLRARSAKSEDFHPEDVKGPHPWFTNRKLNDEPVELTSRESTEKIKKAKDRLNQMRGSAEHVDVLLASNMISVGVDIDRLGLMIVAGQPKTTAEYIQASSRVGRQADRPGLVITCMNVHKPRDRSHYERFAHYHQSFYRYVEATSVTPFSGPALDRGLTGTLMSMARFIDGEMTPADGVMHVAKHKQALNQALAALRDRAARQPGFTQDQEAELKDQVEKRGRNLLETWEMIVASTQEEPVKRRYSKFDKEKSGGAPLLYQALSENAPDPRSPEGRFCAPTSMRDVEDTSHLWVSRYLGAFGGGKAGD
jgi:hypothetical protein